MQTQCTNCKFYKVDEEWLYKQTDEIPAPDNRWAVTLIVAGVVCLGMLVLLELIPLWVLGLIVAIIWFIKKVAESHTKEKEPLRHLYAIGYECKHCGYKWRG